MSAMDELEQLIRTGREGLALEFKTSMNWRHPATKGKVVKAALAFANKRDGGVLVFGVGQLSGEPRYTVTGMREDDYASFTQDDVAAKVNAHAVPHIDLTVEHRRIDGKGIVAIVVREFRDYPVICSADFLADGKPVVIRGRLYCRSRRLPESTEVQAPEDMRDIMELAVAKGLERYFRLREVERRAEQTAAAQFLAQLRDLEP